MSTNAINDGAQEDPDTTQGTVEHSADCRYCDQKVTWRTAHWEPPETEAPIDESGNYCCDDCYLDPERHSV
jgi:hypothetical protein